MTSHKPVALARNIDTGHIYEWEGENNFTNLSTGKSGVIPTELAAEKMVIPVYLNQLVNDNPQVYELIKKLQLVMERSVVES